jgi:hypothetical protein
LKPSKFYDIIYYKVERKRKKFERIFKGFLKENLEEIFQKMSV